MGGHCGSILKFKFGTNFPVQTLLHFQSQVLLLISIRFDHFPLYFCVITIFIYMPLIIKLQFSAQRRMIYSLRQRRNRRHFGDDSFRCIFLNENVFISIKFSLKFIPKGPITNISALVQIMAWRQPDNKPLSESMVIILLPHICVTWLQWVNASVNEMN